MHNGDGSPPPGGICPTARCWPGCGWSRVNPRSRCWCRSRSTAARPCSSTADTYAPSRAHGCRRSRRRRRDPVTITARLRDSEPLAQGKEPFREGGAQQVYSINTEQIAAVTGVPLAGVVSATGRESARRAGRHRPAPPRRRTVPVLRHPVDRVRHHRADRPGLLRVFARCVRADGRRRRRTRPTQSPTRRSRRGETRRPLRPTALRTTASAGTRPPARRVTSAPPGRDPRPAAAARRQASGRIWSSWAYWVGPPRRTPKAPANAASTTPAFGLGWRAASRRHARIAPAPVIHPPPVRTPPPASPSPVPRRNWPHRRNELRPSRTGHSAANGCRSSRPACWRRGRPARRAPRRRRPTTSAPPAHRRCSRRPIPAPRGSGPPRRAPRGRVRTATAAAAGRLRRRRPIRRAAIRSPVRASDVPPSATNTAAAVTAAVASRPRAPGRPLDGHAHHAERAQQHAAVHDPGAAGVGVAQPLQSRCAAAEKRHRMAALRVAEERDRRASRRRFRRRDRGDVAQTPRQRLTRWCTRTHEAGSTAAPDPGGRPAQPRGRVDARGERDHAAGVAGGRATACWRARWTAAMSTSIRSSGPAPQAPTLPRRRSARTPTGTLIRSEVDSVHALVRSTSSSPVSYNAFDPRLQLWVAACLYRYYIDQHEFLYGPLDDDAAEAVYRDAKKLGTTLQVRDGHVAARPGRLRRVLEAVAGRTSHRPAGT